MSLSSGFADAAEYDDLPKQFFELVTKGDMGAGFEYLMNTYPKTDPDINEETRKKLVKQLAHYGAYAFHEQLKEEKFGTRYAKLTYIIGYEYFPLEVTLTLYRPKEKWIVLGFVWKSPHEGAFSSQPPK